MEEKKQNMYKQIINQLQRIEANPIKLSLKSIYECCSGAFMHLPNECECNLCTSPKRRPRQRKNAKSLGQTHAMTGHTEHFHDLSLLRQTFYLWEKQFYLWDLLSKFNRTKCANPADNGHKRRVIKSIDFAIKILKINWTLIILIAIQLRHFFAVK